jgi:hypothetical protein
MPVFSAKLVAAVIGLQLAQIHPALHSNAMLFDASMSAFLQSSEVQNVCTVYTYDHNGNLLATNNQTFGASATWGSSSYGCFTWTSP